MFGGGLFLAGITEKQEECPVARHLHMAANLVDDSAILPLENVWTNPPSVVACIVGLWAKTLAGASNSVNVGGFNMPITVASIAPFVLIMQLLGKIIEYITELQKNSRKHNQALAEIKAALAHLKKMLEEEIEARKKEQALSASDRALTRKLVYGAGALACSSWIYIGLHLAGLIR